MDKQAAQHGHDSTPALEAARRTLTTGLTEEKMEQRVRRYKPLNVDTWGDGFRQATGWILVITFAVVTGGLFAMYELLILYPGDRDVRDMSYDRRVSNFITNKYHKRFINGDQCCHRDVYPGSPASASNYDAPCQSSLNIDGSYLGRVEFVCPPLVQMRCPGGTGGAQCSQLRSLLYRSLGMALDGQYIDCPRAGRLRVGSVDSGGGPLALALLGPDDEEELRVEALDPASLTFEQVDAFVASSYEEFGDPDHVQPPQRVRNALALDGEVVALAASSRPRVNGMKTINPWPAELFPWPGGNKRCPDTATRRSLFFSGSVTLRARALNLSSPGGEVSTLRFMQDSLPVPHYRVAVRGDSSEDVTELSSAPLEVQVFRLSGLEVRAGLAVAGGGCAGWLLDPTDTNPLYSSSPVYVGSLQELLDRPDAVPAAEYAVSVTLRDVSEPRPPALPPYGGMWFIFGAFAMAGIWLFGLGFFILFAIPTIWLNVRSNNGLPPMVWKYMRKYRGW